MNSNHLEPFSQEILQRTGNRFEVVPVTSKPAAGEVGTLVEQLNLINESSANVVLPPHLKVFDPHE